MQAHAAAHLLAGQVAKQPQHLPEGLRLTPTEILPGRPPQGQHG